jgi:hypothetical protein
MRFAEERDRYENRQVDRSRDWNLVFMDPAGYQQRIAEAADDAARHEGE